MNVRDAAGNEVAQGEAGVNPAHRLPVGNHKVAVMAGDKEWSTPVKLEVAKPIVLNALIKGDKLVVD